MTRPKSVPRQCLTWRLALPCLQRWGGVPGSCPATPANSKHHIKFPCANSGGVQLPDGACVALQVARLLQKTNVELRELEKRENVAPGKRTGEATYRTSCFGNALEAIAWLKM